MLKDEHTTRFFFFIGTTAELIKVAPVMREFARRGTAYEIIASGQNDIAKSQLFAQADLRPPLCFLNKTLKRKTPLALAAWFGVTFLKGVWRMPSLLRGIRRKDAVLIVHGDTVSTVMGAMLGRLMRVRVAHVEAGLRSRNFLQPFPEELDRFLTSFFVNYHFCPYPSAVANLRHRGGVKVSTDFNTNIDALEFARSVQRAEYTEPIKRPYFIFILHRQENILNTALVKELVKLLLQVSDKMTCLFVTHELTMSRLKELGLYDTVAAQRNIVLSSRKPYLEFVRLLTDCEFIMTDGGGNQQECYYLGKPCLILRELTESEEGVGTNVVISRNDSQTIKDFVENYARYRQPEVRPTRRPSEIIVDVLTGNAKT